MSDKYGWQPWKEIAKAKGISRATFVSRLQCGWDAERAATHPIRPKIKKSKPKDNQLYTVFLEYEPVYTGLARDCAAYLEVSQNAIRNEAKINRCIVFEVE